MAQLESQHNIHKTRDSNTRPQITNTNSKVLTKGILEVESQHSSLQPCQNNLGTLSFLITPVMILRKARKNGNSAEAEAATCTVNAAQEFQRPVCPNGPSSTTTTLFRMRHWILKTLVSREKGQLEWLAINQGLMISPVGLSENADFPGLPRSGCCHLPVYGQEKSGRP